jgi:hypothetical protein
MRKTQLLLGLAAVLAGAAPLAAQNGTERPSVFFDCDGRNCNFDYYRTEIGWLNWVRDRADSDVHVIMTSTQTGAGGREYQLDFLGVTGPEGYEDQFRVRTLATDTDREELDAIAEALALGIARFAATAGYRGLVSVQGAATPAGDQTPGRLVSQDEVDDPWNLWSFRINGNGNLDGESTRDNTRLFFNFNASRVTPTWKLNFGGNTFYTHLRRELSDGEFVDNRTDWGFNQLVAYALADHWSVGFQGRFARMTQENQDFMASINPAIEFSVFPYAEATRRSLTVFYEIGPTYRNYIEETVYGYADETRFEQSIEVDFSQRQPWGDASVSIEGSHYLHDLALNNLSLRGDINFRVVRGFSVNARANIGWVNDQIYLSSEGVTDEEALLDLRRQGTDFSYGVSLGFSVQFGSIYNNVVNNRFRGAGGFGGGGGGRGFF